MAEHLLQGAQVAAPLEHVGGEAVAQRVGAHALLEAGAAGVALDDLVEALAGEGPAAVVYEQALLEAQAHERRTSAFTVEANGAHGLAADRDDALLGALALGAEQSLVEVHVGEAELDGLGGAQAAGVDQLQEGAVAQRERIASAGPREQAGDVLAGEDGGQAAALRGSPEVVRGVVLDQLLAPEVLVEGAQAGCLALQGRRARRRTIVVAERELGEECGEVLVR